MPDFDSTEAPVTVTVDDPDEYTGHMDDRPVKVALDDFRHDSVAVSWDGTRLDGVQVSMSPAEAYHFADDLQAAADACWGATEYVVNAVRPDGGEMAYLTTIKAPTPDDAVRRALELLRGTGDSGGPNAELADAKLDVVEDSDAFRVYRADSMTTVQRDDDN